MNFRHHAAPPAGRPLNGADLRSLAHVIPHVEFTHAMDRQGQSCRLFCPWGQVHRGFENPRLFKDRPADGNPAASQHTILLRPWSTISRRNPHAITTTLAIIRRNADSSQKRINIRVMHPRPQGGLSIAGGKTSALRGAAPSSFLQR